MAGEDVLARLALRVMAGRERPYNSRFINDVNIQR